VPVLAFSAGIFGIVKILFSLFGWYSTLGGDAIYRRHLDAPGRALNFGDQSGSKSRATAKPKLGDEPISAIADATMAPMNKIRIPVLAQIVKRQESVKIFLHPLRGRISLRCRFAAAKVLANPGALTISEIYRWVES
jgi:hypothetical protein